MSMLSRRKYPNEAAHRKNIRDRLRWTESEIDMVENGACKDCKAHGAFRVRIDHTETTNIEQWKEIDGMKKLLIGTLTTSFISMIGIVFMVLLQLAKAH